ncbi:MAG: M48 family metallopeptidase [Alphaproteobacteria bacterium]
MPKNRSLIVFTICANFFALSLLSSCATVPITGRRQLSIVPASQMLSMSYQEYGEFLKSNKLSTDRAQIALVKRVGGRIQGAVEKYFAQNNMSDRLKDYQWDFNLVESKEANAWCMPGGKVVVYTGILPATMSEEGLAVVMGHEIAHAIAEHGSERMSQALIAQMGGKALDQAMATSPAQTKQLWMSVYGAGVQYGALLPYSRVQESEADHLGLIFMAIAGYDPREALTFWERMAKSKDGKAPPEFLSTHPSDETRIRQIRELLPEAEGYYKKR